MHRHDRGRMAIGTTPVILNPEYTGKFNAKPGIKALFISGYTDDILTSKRIYKEELDSISKPIHMQNFMLKTRTILDR